MHVVDGAAPCLLVEVVGVLRAEEDLAAARGQPGLEGCEALVRGVRLRGEEVAAAPVVEVVDGDGIAREGLGVASFIGSKLAQMPPPRPTVAEGAEAAFGRNACAGEDEDLHAAPAEGAGAHLREPGALLVGQRLGRTM